MQPEQVVGSVTKLRSIQALRALAAWVVVVHHFVQIFFEQQPTLQGYAQTPLALWTIGIFSRYGADGVDLFFVISGFVMLDSTFNKVIKPVTFFLNRLIRIIPAYWFYTLVAALIAMNSDVMLGSSFTPIFLIQSLFFVPAPNPGGIGYFPLLTVGWTLNYEMVFYVLFALALVLRPTYRVVAIAVGIFLLQHVVPTLGGTFRYYAADISFEFFMGVVLGFIYCRGWLRMPAFVAVLMTLLGLAVVAYAVGHELIRVGIGSALIIAAVVSQEQRLRVPTWLVRLGDWSYSTYLCHSLVLLWGYRAALVWHLNPWLVLVGCSAMIWALSNISYANIERRSNTYLKNLISARAP